MAMMTQRPRGGRAVLGSEKRFAPGVADFITMTAPNTSPGPFRYRPDAADAMTLPGRPTSAVVGPAIHPSRDPAAAAAAAAGRAGKGVFQPGPGKYANLELDALSVHSGFSNKVATTFGRAGREQPLVGDFVHMSAPPTSGGQKWCYEPMSPKSLGSHASNQFGGASSWN